MQDANDMSLFCINNLTEFEYVFHPSGLLLEMSQVLINDLEKGLNSIRHHQIHEPLDYHIYYIKNYHK
jgi:hypothetical protein